jgi:hypothetical protein
VTEPQVEIKRGFWGDLFTGPRIVSFLVMLGMGFFGFGQYVQGLKSEVASLRDRIFAIEVTLPRDYQRKDTIEKDLAAIRREQETQGKAIEKVADAVDGLRKDLR